MLNKIGKIFTLIGVLCNIALTLGAYFEHHNPHLVAAWGTATLWSATCLLSYFSNKKA